MNIVFRIIYLLSILSWISSFCQPPIVYVKKSLWNIQTMTSFQRLSKSVLSMASTDTILRSFDHYDYNDRPIVPENDENRMIKKRKGNSPEFAIDGDSTEETVQQRGILGFHFLLFFINLFLSYLSILSLGHVNILTMTITIISSILLGDFATGVFHWSVDNYGNINTPIFGKVCAAFQGHHITPWTITFRPFANNVYKIAYGTIPALLFLSIIPCSLYTRVFFTLFINWWLLSQEFHKYAHMRQVPRVVKYLQDYNIILSRKEHGLHHASPFEGNYCILTGICNPILDKSNFFRHLEKIFFQLTGNKPNTWKEDPKIEKLALVL